MLCIFLASAASAERDHELVHLATARQLTRSHGSTTTAMQQRVLLIVLHTAPCML